MTSYPIASDLSYLVAQKIRQEREMGTCALDLNHQRLHVITGYSARVFVADVEDCIGDCARPNPREVAAVGESDSE